MWLVDRISSTTQLTNLDSIIENEFIVSYKAASRYPSNYHAWNYKRHLLSLSLKFNLSLMREIERSWLFCLKDLRDCSSWSYRKVIINETKEFTSEIQECRKILDFVGCSDGWKCVLKHVEWCTEKQEGNLNEIDNI